MKSAVAKGVLSVVVSIAITVPAVAADCASAGKQRSKSGDQATTLTFAAKGAGLFKVYWIDYEGARVFYNDLRGGGQFVQQTFLTHPWMVTKMAGGKEICVGVFLPQKGGSKAIVK